MNDETAAPREGGCLCAGVRYRLHGKCRNIIICHCENCRRTHGHVSAYTAVDQLDLELTRQESLQWYHDASPNTWRGFCNRCGASLFWDRRDGQGRISIAAGSLDDASGLSVVGHIFMREAGRYYEVDDGLPRFDSGSGGALEADGNG